MIIHRLYLKKAHADTSVSRSANYGALTQTNSASADAKDAMCAGDAVPSVKQDRHTIDSHSHITTSKLRYDHGNDAITFIKTEPPTLVKQEHEEQSTEGCNVYTSINIVMNSSRTLNSILAQTIAKSLRQSKLSRKEVTQRPYKIKTLNFTFRKLEMTPNTEQCQ